MNITILGTGVYGLSMAIALSKNENNHITMWTESKENLKNIELKDKLRTLYKINKK